MKKPHLKEHGVSRTKTPVGVWPPLIDTSGSVACPECRRRPQDGKTKWVGVRLTDRYYIGQRPMLSAPESRDCTSCGGLGVRSAARTPFRSSLAARRAKNPECCSGCDGTGQMWAALAGETCWTCAGVGLVPVFRRGMTKLPAYVNPFLNMAPSFRESLAKSAELIVSRSQVFQRSDDGDWPADHVLFSTGAHVWNLDDSRVVREARRTLRSIGVQYLRVVDVETMRLAPRLMVQLAPNGYHLSADFSWLPHALSPTRLAH